MQNPIYTEVTSCRDCYKCVRSCPVKAIQIKDGHAMIIKDRCIYCGKCVHVCPIFMPAVILCVEVPRSYLPWATAGVQLLPCTSVCKENRRKLSRC